MSYAYSNVNANIQLINSNFPDLVQVTGCPLNSEWGNHNISSKSKTTLPVTKSICWPNERPLRWAFHLQTALWLSKITSNHYSLIWITYLEGNHKTCSNCR